MFPNSRISQEEKRLTYSNNTTKFDFIHEESGSYDVLSTKICIIVYSVMIATIFLVAIARSISFYNVCIKASRKLHDNMFKALISTTMRFFNINPPGRILNRFSRDIGYI